LDQPAESGAGRIVIGGTTLANGYRTPPEPDPFAEPGWFRTDDLGTIDSSGHLRVLGRIDEAISTGGLTVMPGPVEAALIRHPAITDCAIFGVEDERLGERVVAAVVLAPGAVEPSLEDIRAHLGRSLDTTAAPRELHVVDELPRRGIGKLDRAALRVRFNGWSDFSSGYGW
jgi:O-succinylbenzoic acid--CoA ligase